MLHFGVIVTTTNEALDSEQCILWVSNSLTLSSFSHQDFTVIIKSNHRWNATMAFGVLEHTNGITVQYCNARISRTEVNTNNLSHWSLFPADKASKALLWNNRIVRCCML